MRKEPTYRHLLCKCGSEVFLLLTNVVISETVSYPDKFRHKCIECGTTYDSYGSELFFESAGKESVNDASN